MVVVRKRKRKSLRLTRTHAGERSLERGQHLALAQRDRKVARLTTLKFEPVDRAGEVDERPITFFRRTRDRLVAGALLAQNVDRAVDVGRSDLDHRPGDRDRRHVTELDLRIHLEHRRESELILRDILLGLDTRVTRDS